MARKNLVSVPVCYCLHDDHWYLDLFLRSFESAGPAYTFISRTAWNGSIGDWERCAKVAESLGAEVIIGDWPNEELHRQTALAAMREKGYRYVFTPDSDEVIEPELLSVMQKIAKAELADRVMCHFDTYWKSAEYIVRPREAIRPLMLLNIENAHHVFCREYDGGRALVLGPEYGAKEFTYKGLFKCGHCGCQMTAELKKGIYVYYHCTGQREKCPGQKTVREEAITSQLSDMLQGLNIEQEVHDWLVEALRGSYEEERSLHDEETTALRSEAESLRRRLREAYKDKVNGLISLSTYTSLSKEW